MWSTRAVCCALSLLMLPVGASRAGDVAFSGVLPNGAVFNQRVESMQERRFRNVVRQKTDYSCGAAALATILRYAYHLDADEGTVIEGMMGVSDPQLV
ncbi:MAG: peptidase, partial [Stenotrophomonas sp.]